MVGMKIDYDYEKNRINVIKHGIDFDEVEYFDWDSAAIYNDERKDYGEERRVALGCIKQRVHFLVYTTRQDFIRVISLRKANKREMRIYDQFHG